MRPSFRVGLFASCCFGGMFAVTIAAAQPNAPTPAGRDRSNSQFTLRHDGAGAPDAEAGRARALAGDCEGALVAFDQALRTSIDIAVRRDRGLCHEKLNHPFPAMEDFRAYLHAKPEAPDSEDIRRRLAALEGASGAGGAAASDSRETPEAGINARASGTGSVESGGARASTSSDEPADLKSPQVLGPKPGEPVHEFDYYVKQEQLVDQARVSPLRYGSGFVLGPFMQLPRFYLGKSPTAGELAYAVGLTFRYATGRTLALVSELGYAGIGTSGEPSSSSGVLLLGGVELRFPVSKLAGDHLLLRGGVGYERQQVSGTRFLTDNVLGRFAFGFRHVFGPSLGLEALIDGGPVLAIPERGDSRVNGVVGLSLAVVVGF